MQEPTQPTLSLITCLTGSLSTWASNLPVLFISTLVLSIPTLALFPVVIAGSLAGLSVVVLDAMEGRNIRIRSVFRPFRHPVRFVVLSTCLSVGVALWCVLILMVIPPGVLPRLLAEVTSDLPAFQITADNWGLTLPATFLILVLVIELTVLALRSYYVPVIVAHLGTPIVDAYIESRNTVRLHGYLKHAGLLSISVLIVVLPILILPAFPEGAVSVILFLPVSLGIFAPAYRQTITVNRRNALIRERQFTEMRDELQTAHDMQMDLLPDRPPELPGYSLDGISVPANNVGGDYFAYRWLDEEEQRLAIVVADVSGKAMHAAVTALRFSEILRYECRGRTEPGPILDGLTQAIDERTDDATFVTCCIAVLHTESGRLEIANAGHCYPYRVSGTTGTVSQVDISGLPLGIPAIIRPDEPYASVILELEPNDGILLYSDGVIEAQDPKGDMYDEERLETIAGNTLFESDARSTVRSVYRAVDTFAGDANRADDITVVALKRNARDV